MAKQMTIRHEGLGKCEVITGNNPYEVCEKADRQMEAWNQEWKEKLEEIEREKEKEKVYKEKVIEAGELIRLAHEQRQKYKGFLKDHLLLEPICWEDGKDFSKFSEPQPEVEVIEFKEKEPLQKNFKPRIGFFEKRDEEKVKAKTKLAEEEYKKALDEYNDRLSKYKEDIQKYNNALENWEKREELFYENQNKNNELIEKNQLNYGEKDKTVIDKLADIVLSKFSYPKEFLKEFIVDFNSDNNILVVDFTLPSIENMPNIKEVKYSKSEEAFINSYIPDSELESFYDSLLYQITLTCINELYKADYQEIIESVVFNGWLKTVDPGTGKDITLCILSIQASREEFLSLDLSRVDPKECFRSLKGIGSPKLHTVTPVAPIIKMDKRDKRFISSYDVMGVLDDSENLALMDWKDFEHLIREIFEKEFSQNGGEVKITQSSRDGGVDAIAFDPDPIRGGKIVIQAKRYTNIVGVSAVRDLYGTVHNEGAIKGILVTTSDYGIDAYNFAKGKPLTLLNGSNLLHLLGKYGRKAKIDLKEARKFLDQNK
jgi:restriction system protein